MSSCFCQRNLSTVVAYDGGGGRGEGGDSCEGISLKRYKCHSDLNLKRLPALVSVAS